MHLVDIYPAKAFFLPGETVQLLAEVSVEQPGAASLHVSIMHLAELVAQLEIPLTLKPGLHQVPVEWRPASEALRGYGVAARLVSPTSQPENACFTAFDVLSAWTDYPRYGFLSDFWPHREDLALSLDSLVKYHINGLQFYDWQYRHDTLMPPTEEYLDPLGRRLSLKTVEQCIAAAHQRGMAAMPYLAVYAASNEFAQSHPDWALYDESGDPYAFEDFLGLMDPSPKSPWISHLLEQCADVLDRTDFDGLHVDQYGEPRTGFTSVGAPVDIPKAFAAFIGALKSNQPQAPVTFNAVKNWPIDALAASPQDFLYIELWPNMPRYRDLFEVIAEARARSGAKPLVIALYLPAERPNNVRLANALILASGATRIELGERERLLSDPYFPKHEAINAELAQTLRAYADFSVRYGELFGPHAQDLMDSTPILPEGVWSVVRKSGNRIAISLINMRGLEDPQWTDSHPQPQPLQEFQLSLDMQEQVTQVYWASPDLSDPMMSPLAWETKGHTLSIIVPKLDFWTTLLIQTRPKQ